MISPPNKLRERKIMLSSLIHVTNIKPENKVVGFSGSPRKNGNSDILLKTIVSGVNQEEISADYWNLTDIQFKGCIGCEKCRKNQNMHGAA